MAKQKFISARPILRAEETRESEYEEFVNDLKVARKFLEKQTHKAA